MKKELIIFDLDGTLYKTEEVSVPALKEAFSRFNIMVSEDTILNQFGEPTDQIIDNLVPEEKSGMKDEIKKAIIEKESEFIPMKATLYDEVKEILSTLKERDYKLAICSNGRYDYIEKVLETTSIMKYFSSIKSYSENNSKADRIKGLLSEFAVEDAIVVGDRYHDIEAAEKAGVKSVGALYGYGGEEAKKADFVIEEPEELLSIVLS
ncbi:MAG: HAD family hydrolase [Candidatus Thermoplasmatota archaeon]